MAEGETTFRINKPRRRIVVTVAPGIVWCRPAVVICRGVAGARPLPVCCVGRRRTDRAAGGTGTATGSSQTLHSWRIRTLAGAPSSLGSGRATAFSRGA